VGEVKKKSYPFQHCRGGGNDSLFQGKEGSGGENAAGGRLGGSGKSRARFEEERRVPENQESASSSPRALRRVRITVKEKRLRPHSRAVRCKVSGYKEGVAWRPGHKRTSSAGVS